LFFTETRKSHGQKQKDKIKIIGNPSFLSPVHSFQYGPYTSVTEEWLYNNYLGDNRVLVIVVRRNKFQKYYFK
jgi:hypothetical protein